MSRSDISFPPSAFMVCSGTALLVCMLIIRSSWPRGLRDGFWLLENLDRGFESCLSRRCVSAFFSAVMFCVGRVHGHHHLTAHVHRVVQSV
jgi:hypothetical protein